ncbi:MAG TPA: succinyldiaminopimelate transaminase [Mycobacteriales bacterium]|nr:succinyldiaminopimelate transaminase [Mycobacteriales bacterium]
MSLGDGHALPDFPWDRLTPYADAARAHPDGLVDLSIGTPVDPTPAVVTAALSAAADAPGYPAAAGTPAVREAASAWLSRRLGVACPPDQVVPTIGSKELVALLPFLLGAKGSVLFPALAYPTYDVGARLAGCRPVAVPMSDGLVDVAALDGVAHDTSLLWINYPANPHGRVAPAAHVAEVVAWGRARGVLIVSDECYAELAWDAPFTSALVDGTDGVLAVHSLSKRSNAAGLRAGFVAGDRDVVARLLAVRRQAGFLVPAPVQAAMVAALGDDAHVEEQRARYAARREVLRAAADKAGLVVEYSEGGLYLWATHPSYDGCWPLVDALARRGILVAPGEFYGDAGARHVRIALTATDERVAAAARRLEEDQL